MEETLEEAAEKYVKHFAPSVKSAREIGFIDGAKYQAERMYSEEEVRELLIKALTHNDYNFCGSLTTAQNEIRSANFGVWFEHFKKK